VAAFVGGEVMRPRRNRGIYSIFPRRYLALRAALIARTAVLRY
jgi:hypothetical protein